MPANDSSSAAIPVVDLALYRIDDVTQVLTPSVAIYPDLIAKNIDRAILWAGGNPGRLRPHAKTHKTIQIVTMELERGISRHKCATLAEAEMLVRAGVKDILVAYPVVGPNAARIAAMAQTHRDIRFSVLVDHPISLANLAGACRQANCTMNVMVDLDGGMGRTGIAMGPAAIDLYRSIHEASNLRVDGFQLYDGNVEEPDPTLRQAIVDDHRERLTSFIRDVEAAGLTVPRIVVAGTGTFPLWLKWGDEEPRLEASPGTFVYSDWNYHCRFPDVDMVPAAIALTRVISKPRPGRLTCDLGHKAVAADPIAANRVHFLSLSQWEFVRQSEEHLVVDTPDADLFEPGDVLYAIPYHICPTCALHRDMLVVRDGRVIDRWTVVSRDREIG